MRFGPGVPIPPVVKQLLIINLAVFVIEWLPGVESAELNGIFGLVPADVFASGRVWQLVTYMFLHGGLFHILFNMLILWMFGSSVEARWGSRDFLTYYMICGVGGALLSWITGPNSQVAIIGASGAVLGVLVAYTLMYPDRQVLIYFLFPIKMKYLIWVLVAIDLIGAFSGSQGGTAHFAHLGGMATGFLFLKQDWRLGAFGRKMRASRARRTMRKQAERQERAQESARAKQEEIDRILEKISAHGMDSLTPEELKTLREASRHH
jgi:membrane associated rhomboid family serine protease